MLKSEKGQISIGDAPMFIMIIGLIFLVMSTIALVGERYQDSLSVDLSGVSANETVSSVVNTTRYTLGAHSECNVAACTITNTTNRTGNWQILSGNYTISDDCLLTVHVSEQQLIGGDWGIEYNWRYSGAACNVTSDLQTEIGGNTSLAGLVLTIGLVGLVLTILMGVFFMIRTKRGAGV